MSRGRDRTEAIKSEQREANNRGGSRYFYVDTGKLDRLGITQYKTEGGPNFVRIISPKFEKHDKLPYFGKKVYSHTKIGADESTFLCLRKMFNEPCPVCELMEEIKAANPDDERLKDLAPKLRYLFFVVDVNNTATEEKGLRWYDAPIVVNDNIAELSQDRRANGIIDPSDPDKGKDIEFVRSGSGLGTKYKGFRFHDNDPIPNEWLDDAPEDFEGVLKKPTYEDMAKEVSGGSSKRSSGTSRRSRGSDEGEAKEEVVEEGGRRSRRGREVADKEEEQSSRRGRVGGGDRGDRGPSNDTAARVNEIAGEEEGDDND